MRIKKSLNTRCWDLGKIAILSKNLKASLPQTSGVWLREFTNSITETHFLAKKILKNLPANLICLYGELGAGKTTFVQGLAKALGIKKRVLSPSFVLMREYPIKIKNLKFQPKSAKGDRPLTRAGPPLAEKMKNLFHIDCYRIESEEDIRSIDLKELWSDPKNLVVIEWAERLKKILPKKRVDVKFEYIDKDKRKITFL